MPRIRECVSHGCLRQHRHVAAGLTVYGSVKVPPHLFGSPRQSSSKSVRPRIHISGPLVHCMTPNEPFFIGISFVTMRQAHKVTSSIAGWLHHAARSLEECPDKLCLQLHIRCGCFQQTSTLLPLRSASLPFRPHAPIASPDSAAQLASCT